MSSFSQLHAVLANGILTSPTVAELPSSPQPVEGDIRWVEDVGQLYAYHNGTWQPAGGGIVGPIPGVSTDNAIVRWDGTDGNSVKNSTVTVSDSGVVAGSTVLAADNTLDAPLEALAAYNTNGLLTQTAANTFTGRTISAGSAKVTVTNGSGVSGNPTVDLGTVTTTDVSEGSNLYFTDQRVQDYIDTIANLPNGVVVIDPSGKIPVTLLPPFLTIKGAWSAATNTPTLSNGTGTEGDVWVCSAGGTVNFGAGNVTFATGDWAIYSAAGQWFRSENSTSVASVNGFTGAVVLDTDDINEGSSNLYYTDARSRAAFSTSDSSTIGFTYNPTLGVLSADVLPLPNSLTTATSSNTASTIVARDGSGNFSAGTITANLTGNASGTASNITGTVAIANGGTGQTTANAGLNALLPTQSTHGSKVLVTDGTNTSWALIGNGNIAGAASIDRTKLAPGSNNHVIINNGSGVLSSEASLAISRGGTGQATANAGLNALLPTQTGQSGKVLTTDGTDTSWQAALTNPMTTASDLILGGSGGTPTRLAVGSSGTVLRSNGTAASWTANSAANVSYSNGTSGLTANTAQAAIDEVAAKGIPVFNTWSPTYSPQSNITGTPTGTLRYFRVGGMAWIYGKIYINTTAAGGTQTSLNISLPTAILSNVFASDDRAGGSFTRFSQALNAGVTSITSTTLLSVIFNAATTGSNSYYISCMVECN